jgi:protein O-mannosyl-transferase
MDELREALRLRPSSTTHVNLAHLLLLEGQTPAAIEHFRQAMTLSPEWSVPPAGLSWVFSSHPDSSIRRPGEAIELAERAMKLAHGNEAIVRDALAAAYASAGRFEEAVANAALASDLARRDGASELASQMEERVALYRRGRPFVQR